MKKLNEGPTIKTDHKGSHLTNADGEVVQSFAKDRAGLKAARQSMYKNYKGLNMKKPEPQEPVEEDSAVDPRINIHRGEQVMKNNYRKNAGVDMPADKVAKMQSTRADWDADNEAKFGKFDWNKTPEFEKPNARASELNKQAKAARANFKSPTLTPQERETYKQSRNAQTAQANKQRVANGQTPFAMEDTITENTGGFEVRLDNGGRVPIGKHTFTYHVNDASEANAVARSAEKSGMTVLDIDSEEIRIDAQAHKHSSLVNSLQDLEINGYITEGVTVHPSMVSQKGRYKVFYSIQDSLKVAQITRWAVKNNITVRKYDTDKFIIRGNASDHRSMVSYLRNKGISADATVMNPLITKDTDIYSDDDINADIKQTYNVDDEGHLVTGDGDEVTGPGISTRIQQKIQQDRLMHNEDNTMSNLDKKLKKQLEEGITVNTTSTNDDNVENNVNVTATGADAMELMNMLKMAGIGGQTEAPIEEIPSEDEGCGCSDMPNEIDSMRDMIGTMDNINVEVIPMEDKTVEESTDSSLVHEIVKHLASYDTPTQDEIFRVVKTFEPNDEARDKLYQEVLDAMESTDSSLVDEIVKHLAFYYDTPTQDEIFRVVKTFEPNDEARDDLYQEVLDEMGFIEEDAELANAPDEKYADTDTLVNKISGGLNRRKKAYAKAENGDNPMAVTESEEELTTRLLKEYDEFKVTAPADSEEGNWEIENVGKWAVKIGNTENVEATDGELDLPFDTDLASALADEAMTEVKKPDADGDGIPDWADKDEECKYCGGECPQDEEHACDGYLGDIDNLYADEELQEDDVEEGLRMEFPDGSCEGSKCPDDRNRRKKPKKLDTDTDALDDEMSEDKK